MNKVVCKVSVQAQPLAVRQLPKCCRKPQGRLKHIPMRPSWLKISAILAGLWLVVGSVLWYLKSVRPSPEKLVAYADANTVTGKTEAQRKSIIEAVASGYHQLDIDDRRELLISQGLKTWWTELTMPERLQFRLLLFPQYKQVVDFFDSLPAEQRERNLQRLLADTRKLGGDDVIPQFPPQVISMAKTFGIKQFFGNPMLDQNIGTLLLMHELEKRIVWRRR